MGCVEAVLLSQCVLRSNMRYVLHPGWIHSKNDGDRHFIGGHRLTRLYGVDMRQCIYGDVSNYIEQEGDIHLYPRYQGDYSLPEAK